ncbi:unnamed protein product, partial [Effrenium voratum]
GEKGFAAKVFKERGTSGRAPAEALREAELLQLAAGSGFVSPCFGLFEAENQDGTGSLSTNMTRASSDFAPANRYFLLLEAYDMSLLQLVNCRSLSEAESALVTDNVLRGLAHLHSKRIIHADLKPANIMLADAGRRLVLMDLGLSKQVPAGSCAVACCGGTAGYAAPEVLRRSRCGFSADIFSLGAVLYLLLFQKEAFVRDTFFGSYTATVEGRLPKPKSVGAWSQA